MYHSVAIVAIYTPIKLIWSLKGDSLQERGKKRQIFFLPPSLFPAHVQLLTALTTPPPRWKQRQTERRQFKMREMLYQTSNLLRVCSPLPDRLICGCLRLMEGFQSKKKHQQQKNLKIFRLKRMSQWTKTFVSLNTPKIIHGNYFVFFRPFPAASALGGAKCCCSPGPITTLYIAAD